MGFMDDRSEPLMSEESFLLMAERECQHFPRADYLHRLRSGGLDLGVRRESFDWIWKAHAHYSFRPLTICLSMNYLDRFLSVYELPGGKTWIAQLLAVACLSLAAKMEEPSLPLTVDLQVGEPKFMFEGKTIQRMELLVLKTLSWKMQPCTPFSFIDYFIVKISNDNQLNPLGSLISRSVKFILSTIKAIDFLEFRPSEIAAAVAISVLGEKEALDIHKAISCFIHVEKGRVLKCHELIQDLALMSSGDGSTCNAGSASVPQSPIGVLDAACLGSKRDDLTIGSCFNSSHNSSPDEKRRKLDKPKPSEENLQSEM